MLLFFVLAPIAASLIVFLIPREKLSGIFAIAFQAIIFAASVLLFFEVAEEPIITNIGNFEWNLGIIIRADALNSTFILLGSLIFLFTTIFNQNNKNGGRFWLFFFIWHGLMNGIFLAQDLFNIFVLVEVVTVVVATLIMINRDKRSTYDGMLYLMINTVAALFFLFGVGIIYRLTGSLDVEMLRYWIANAPDANALLLPASLILASLALKCALIPFCWLPRAHAALGAPTIVSAVISGLHVKSSLYILMLTAGLFSGVVSEYFFLVTGIITGTAGFIYAISQTDIKLILAYSTFSQIGLIIIGFSLDSEYSQMGSYYHMINHAIFKSVLFLCSGLIARAYKTRELSKIRGLLRRMPLVSIATILAILGITGTPLLNGSISKYFIVSGAGVPATAAIMFINLGTIIAFIRYSAMLLGKSEDKEKTGIEPYKNIIVLIMGGICLFLGILGEQAIYYIFGTAVDIEQASYIEKVIIFIVSLAAGLLIYKFILRKFPKPFAAIRKFEFGFRGICALLGFFFAALILTGYLL